MSFSLPSRDAAMQHRSRWPGAAFLVEAMVLALFVMAAMAVLTQVFVASAERAQQGEQLSHAVALAQDVAERFAANPDADPGVPVADGLVAVCNLTETPRAGGTMHYAAIRVYALEDGGERIGSSDDPTAWFVGVLPVYTLNTSVYEGGASAHA